MQESNVSESFLLNCKANSDYIETPIGKLYTATNYGNNSSSKALIYNASIPTKKQYEKILNDYNGDFEAANKYIAANIDKLKNNLETLKNVSSKESNLATINEYEISKDENSGAYSLSIKLDDMKPIKQYASENGMTVEDSLKMSMQIINGTDYAHSNNLFHGFIDDDFVFVDSNGRYKVFGYGIAPLVNSEFFDSDRADIGKKDDVASISYTIYKFYNDFKPPFEYNKEEESVYTHIKNAGDSLKLAPPQMANNDISQIILNGLSYNENSYSDCSSFASAVGRVLNSTDKLYLNASLVESPNANKQQNQNNFESQSNYPSPDIAQFDNTGSNNLQNSHNTSQQSPGFDNQYISQNNYQQNRPAYYGDIHDNSKKKKSSKGLIILIIILSVILLGLITVTVLWKCGVISLDSLWGSSSSTVVSGDDEAGVLTFNDTELSIEDGSSKKLSFSLKNIALSDIIFESSNDSIVTVSNEGNITAENKGVAKIYAYDPEGNVLDLVLITVTPKQDVEKINTEYIQSMLRTDSDYGLYVYDFAENKEYMFDNSKKIMGSSALVCLPIIYTYCYDIDNGYLSDDSLVRFQYSYEDGRGIYKKQDDGQLLSAKNMVKTMLKYGDNNCINSLMNHFGISYINDVAQYGGIDGVNVVRNLNPNPEDTRENQISARACGQIFKELISDEGSYASSLINEAFKLNESAKHKGLAKNIYEYDEMLNHNAVTSTKYNEIMYVKSGNCEFVIVFLSNAHVASSQDENMALAGNIGKHIYDSFMSY